MNERSFIVKSHLLPHPEVSVIHPPYLLLGAPVAVVWGEQAASLLSSAACRRALPQDPASRCRSTAWCETTGAGCIRNARRSTESRLDCSANCQIATIALKMHIAKTAAS